MPAYDVFPLMLIRSAGLPFSSLAELAANWKTAENELDVGRAEIQTAWEAVQAAFDAALRADFESLKSFRSLEPPASDDRRQELPENLRTAVYNFRKAFFKKNKLPPQADLARWASDNRYPALMQTALAIKTYQELAEKLKRAETDFQKQYETAVATAIQALQKITGQEP